MGELANFTNALFGAVNTAVKVDNNILSKEAKLSTQNKQIQLQEDIRNKLMDLRTRADYTNWNQEMTGFFEQIKSGMSDPNSKYYCKNNMQGDMFNSILEQNRLGVTEKVGQMVQQREMEKDIVDVQNSKTLLSQTYSGQQYIDMANELDRGLYETGRISLQQYDQQKDLNFKHGYETMYLNTFDASLDQALAAGKSFDQYFTDIENSIPAMKATDTSGLEKAYDKTGLNAAIKKICQQNYYAKLQDIQQGNANSLSQIVQEMRQSGSVEGKLAVARRGQRAMNNMLGLKLSEQDRLQYSAIFELTIDGQLKGSGKGSGSGNGSDKATDSIETLIKAKGDTAVQLWLDGKNGNMYDITQAISDNLVNEWFTGDYKENHDKDLSEREEEYETIYRGKMSSDSITDSIINRLAEKFPTAKNYIDNNFKNLINDIANNPKEYGQATVGSLSMFILDWLGESTSDMTDDDFVEAFKKQVNDCYVESVGYMEFNKKNELKKKYDASNPADIAKAAQLVQGKDYVFTYRGEDIWAPNKKEALEAEGGIVHVLKNAVAGTLGADAGDIDFYYKKTKDDKTSVPIFTYGGSAYEVNATEDGKGFTLTDVNTDKVIDGVVPDKKGERKQALGQAKAAEKTASENTATLDKEREEKTEQAIQNTNHIPKAVLGSKKIDTEHYSEWTKGTTEQRREYLNKAIAAIDSDAKKIEKQKDKDKKSQLREQFEKDYGIKFVDWILRDNEDYRYDLILNSK